VNVCDPRYRSKAVPTLAARSAHQPSSAMSSLAGWSAEARAWFPSASDRCSAVAAWWSRPSNPSTRVDELALERANFFAVTLALLPHLPHLAPDLFERRSVGGVAVGRARRARNDNAATPNTNRNVEKTLPTPIIPRSAQVTRRVILEQQLCPGGQFWRPASTQMCRGLLRLEYQPSSNVCGRWPVSSRNFSQISQFLGSIDAIECELIGREFP